MLFSSSRKRVPKDVLERNRMRYSLPPHLSWWGSLSVSEFRSRRGYALEICLAFWSIHCVATTMRKKKVPNRSHSSLFTIFFALFLTFSFRSLDLVTQKSQMAWLGRERIEDSPSPCEPFIRTKVYASSLPAAGGIRSHSSFTSLLSKNVGLRRGESKKPAVSYILPFLLHLRLSLGRRFPLLKVLNTHSLCTTGPFSIL